ncbi:MAG: glycosyltransferase family 2 protein [Acidobacteria bacterium]|nr:glycosyltransferase family 2 protein [Acidobacteriota bacterium]
MPYFSIIVINWNGLHFLETCLTALERQSFRDFETILVDNGSSDGSAEYVRAHFPQVKVLALLDNLGFSGGNIAGWEQARGEWIVLLNNDTEAHPGWLEALAHAAREFPAAGSLASKMLLFGERDRIDNCGFALTPAGVTIDLGRGERDGVPWQAARPVFGACGGAAAYRRSLLEEIGFLDPDFFMTYEDVDLSFRAQLAGHGCMFVPEAIVYHHYRATMTNYPARQAFYSQRNIEFVYIKNLPLGMLLTSLPQRMLYEVGAAVYFFRQGAGRAFAKAKFAALCSLPILLGKRKVVQARRKISSAQLRALTDHAWLGARMRKVFAARRRTAQPALSSPTHQ